MFSATSEGANLLQNRHYELETPTLGISRLRIRQVLLLLPQRAIEPMRSGSRVETSTSRCTRHGLLRSCIFRRQLSRGLKRIVISGSTVFEHCKDAYLWQRIRGISSPLESSPFRICTGDNALFFGTASDLYISGSIGMMKASGPCTARMDTLALVVRPSLRGG